MDELKSKVHALTNLLQVVISNLEVGNHHKALAACKDAIKGLRDIASELEKISRSSSSRTRSTDEK